MGKILHPMFGVYCRTESFADTKEKDRLHVYLEAFLDDPVKKTWSVNLVTLAKQIAVKPIKQGMPFPLAIELLQREEKRYRDMPSRFKPLFPEAPHMAFQHFRAFAEREGYIFDIDGVPHARPTWHALPPAANFHSADIERANKNLQRPETEFDGHGLSDKIPSTFFIFDDFNRACMRSSLETQAQKKRVLEITDSVVLQIDLAYRKMQEYCQQHASPGAKKLNEEAEDALFQAKNLIKQLKAYKVLTTPFETFVRQCHLVNHALHAKGLYNKLRQSTASLLEYKDEYRQQLSLLLTLFRQDGASDEDVEHMGKMVTFPDMSVPSGIPYFLENYKRTREKYNPPTSGSSSAPPQP